MVTDLTGSYITVGRVDAGCGDVGGRASAEGGREGSYSWVGREMPIWVVLAASLVGGRIAELRKERPSGRGLATSGAAGTTSRGGLASSGRPLAFSSLGFLRDAAAVPDVARGLRGGFSFFSASVAGASFFLRGLRTLAGAGSWRASTLEADVAVAESVEAGSEWPTLFWGRTWIVESEVGE